MKSLKWVIILLPVLFLTGCWSKVEIDEQVFVFALYIDKGKKPETVEVTISSPLPNRMASGQQAGGGGASGKPYAMITKSDVTIPDALRTIEKDLTRRLNFGHTQEIIVGREYAEAGIGDLLNWLHKETSFHINSFLTTAPGKAREIAELTPLYEQMPAEVLRKMHLQHTMISTNVREALIAYHSRVGFATNYMSVGTQAIPSENEQQTKWAGIQGGALYQDDKMKGTLRAEEARMISWAKGRLGRQVYSVSWDGGASHASVLLSDLKATKKVKMINQKPQFTIKLKGSGALILLKDIKQRSNTEQILIITDLLNSKIEKELSSALHITKETGTDVLQLGLLLEWKHPVYWKEIRDDWSEYYKEQSDIQTKIKLDLTNLSNQP